MGDLPDFEDFYAASFTSLCVQLHPYTGDLAEAQDVVQEAFCRALSRWSRISQYDDPVAWVRKVAWNLATSRWRQVRTAHAFVRKQREEHTPGPDPQHVDVVAALAQLPPRQRQAVVMHYLMDTPIAEIAAQTGAAEGTVKSWLHRARTTLDSELRVDIGPDIKPPGSDTARRTVRRRRDRNTLIGVIILVCLAIVAAIVPYQLSRHVPVIKITPSPTATSTPSSEAQATPSAAPAAAAAPSASCISDAKGGAVNGGADAPDIAVKLLEHMTGDSSRPICDGVRVTIRWAAYTADASRNLTLYKTGSVVLDNNRRQATVHIEYAPGCNAAFVTKNDIPIPSYIDADWLGIDGPGGPFWYAPHQETSLLYIKNAC
jgi:RNA polymerase sigma-70 factor, ECF subfamily